MKIIIAAKSVYPFHPVGGVQKYAYHFAKHLSKKGVDVEVVAPLDEGRPRTEKQDGVTFTLLAPSIFRYLEYPVGWWGVHRFSRSLAAYLKGKNFDLLHSFDMTGYSYATLKKRKPVIAQIFTDNYLSNPISSVNPLNFLSFWGRRTEEIKKEKIKISPRAGLKTIFRYPAQYFLKMRPMDQYLKNVDSVFLEDKGFENEVAELFGLDKNKCDVLPVGVDTAFINAKLRDSVLRRKDIHLNDGNTVLLTVNRLAADKGVDKIVSALEDIAKVIPSVKLIIVGDGYEKEEITDLIAGKGLKNKVVHLTGVTEEKLYDIYKLADIYICAFSYPGSSLSVLEAMASSLPVITTAQPWLVADKRNGIFLQNNSPKSICEAVLKIINEGNLKQKGQVSKEKAEQYDWNTVAAAALQKYEQVIRKTGSYRHGMD